MQKGKINVQTENIFPIIKKFLYSDHEIFLRELVSNAVDATQKLKTISKSGDFSGELGDIAIEVTIDKKKKTLTIKDHGIGMTSEEVEKYITQIAFSGAEEFIEKYKTQTEKNPIIGHFGLGFYSSFMVSEKVEIQTKTYKKGPGTKGVKWVCDGSPNYSMEEIDKKDRGTEIILHIEKESEEFLEEHRILSLLKKYCKFLPVEIIFGTEKIYEPTGEKDKEGKEITKEVEKPRIINNTKPLWIQKPVDLKEEDYKSFYHELYPMNFDEPLFNIHLNVDYPFTLTGILYFPKVKRNFEIQKDKIQLYCNQVFVTDSVEGIVPDFLTLLHGVLDSPDIPLNVSRSYLQSDPNVKKISSHITKKVADKLEELFKNNRSDFEAKWDDIRIFIEYGMISEEKFYERAEKFCLLKNTEGKYYTLDEYKDQIKLLQTDKEKNLVYLYATNIEEQHSFIQTAKERGYDVLIMDNVLDSHFINQLERKFEKSKFARVDSDIIDKLIQKDEEIPSKLSEDQKNTLKPIIENQVDKTKFSVQFESLSESEQPILITQNEFMRRMRDMSAVGGGANYFGQLPEQYNLIVNSNHSLIIRLLEEKEVEKQNKYAKQLTDLALLSQNLLKGEELTKFIKRSTELI
ncbi:MAG TPA: molecular chaperone HtpG [Bacteroidales bacterium]|mgnify:CR=1 FL=1|nr:molecular chaperone HtpG [Bacteroidales bacterium]HQI46358.1 molecular chaperone HtpG [Bacteroidales bacterium]